MKKSSLVLLLAVIFLSFNPGSADVGMTPTQSGFKVTPISHATMIINWDGTTIYVDPVGGAGSFSQYAKPDLILVTDIHGDHMSAETLSGLDTSAARIVVPQAVADKLPESLSDKLLILDNGKSMDLSGFMVEAVPMYNLRPEALKFHEKGRGNGYVIEHKGERVYIPGDTEDIPEMRALKNIDRAFVCMNLPYTMTVDSAADAVIEFAPKKVYPYHFRGGDGMSDVGKFKRIVAEANPAINVVQLDWYPN